MIESKQFFIEVENKLGSPANATCSENLVAMNLFDIDKK